MDNDQDFAANIQRNTMRYMHYFEEEGAKLLPPPSSPYIMPDVYDVLQSQRLAALQRAAAADDHVVSDLPSSLMRRFEVVISALSSVVPCKLREIRAEDIGHLVVVKGLVTRSSNVAPRSSVVTYTCEVCGSELFQDVLGPSFMPLQACPSKRCTDSKSAGKLTLQTRGSRFVKHQELRLQELPDQLPMGHVPRSLALHCSGELTRRCGPGDVVTVCGVFLTVKYSGFKAISAGLQADTYLHVSTIEKHKLSFQDLSLQGSKESRLVAEIARDADPYSRLAASIAPEIFGHEDVKKALLLQLVGGVTKDMADGMKIRGDVNILLVGDPGVAKSQLLRYVSSIAPRGVYTTGKGSSSAGLTAALVRDPLTSEMSLEAGALVLADKGICCIDEFDKMSEQDRTGIHEVMEQQTVSIAKAGITASLNARASVLAAANPLYGRYNPRRSISENIDLPSSLLSRFDLVFLLLDRSNLEQDMALSKHVLHVHRHLARPDQLQHPPLPAEVFKQYIAMARSFSPVVPPELANYIVEAYVSLRTSSHSSSSQGSSSSRQSKQLDQAVMTPRQLLSILRLTQALARLRLDHAVIAQDVDEAIRLTHSSKDSLLRALEGAQGGGGAGAGAGAADDPTSLIYAVIKDLALGSADGSDALLDYLQVEGMVLRKGFTVAQLSRCLADYQAIGVLQVDPSRSHIQMFS